MTAHPTRCLIAALLLTLFVAGDAIARDWFMPARDGTCIAIPNHATPEEFRRYHETTGAGPCTLKQTNGGYTLTCPHYKERGNETQWRMFEDEDLCLTALKVGAVKPPR